MHPAHDPIFVALLVGSYERFAGRPLVADRQMEPAWLYHEAPFALLAHDTAADPRFVYANQAAQRVFGYDWSEFVGMPSRLSAELPERAERQRLLDAVTRDGVVKDYAGVRIAKDGSRFRIAEGVVWQLVDAAGVLRGQAAAFPLPG
ncbi:MEKHLA domain-containing protein [Xanthomonas oryzae]|uniref:MEKHLA domain-containing protein n=1 Tax=Xanthomonas oryzae TaxID=347 RepID=A0AAP1EZI1_9XANT|nr:MEKHLA domain-containing protein [Xanthomonas oryzae]KOR43894.1 MEKHLA domain-containing protein [Xanthomonas oryzae]QBG84979.1 MEKHLA domain-containing protein [Xanthomonas oryzae]